ncbi:MAG TPA: hypothetical protein PKH10_01450 [bacterium]|nr:hypothetical protein [bacterium]
MKRKYGMMIGALTAFMFCIGCGEGADPATDDTAPADNDTATLDEDTLVPDVDTATLTKPGDDFNTPERTVLFEFKGLINSYEDVMAQTDTKGVMDLTLKLGDIDIPMNDYPTAYRLLYPDEEQYGELAGTEHLIFGAHGDLKQEGSYVLYYTIIVGMPVTQLEEIKKNKTPDATAETLEARTNLLHTTYLNRADNSIVWRRCMIAVLDKPEESRLFVNFANNNDFTPGENILAWGNIALTTDFDPTKLTGYEEYEGQWCTFKLNDTVITKEQYEEELVKDVTKLDCDLPEGFLDGAGDTSATYTFKGVINEAGTQQNTAGYGTFSVKVAGTEIPVSDYIAVAGTSTGTAGQELVSVESLGGLETITGQNHYKYNYFAAIVDKQTLLDAKEKGDASCLFSGIGDGEKAFVQLFAVEEKQVNSVTYQKVCPTAVLAPLPATSAILYCIGGNTAFAVGEEIQSAANVTLTTDEVYMMEIFEVDSPDKLCGCNENYTTVIECSAFDAVEP